MAHGKALGQYKVIPNGFVWDVIDALGEVVCWSHDTYLKAVFFAIDLAKKENN